MIVVTPEHWTNFFLNNMPSFCLGLAEEYAGPFEEESSIGIPKAVVPGHQRLASALASELSKTMDLSFSHELLLDHGIMVPLHFLTPSMDVPIIPIIVNCLASPMPPLARCHKFGQALRMAVDAWSERVALVGTGGLSHWPAMPEAGKINAEFDLRFLDAFVDGRAEPVTAYSDSEIENQAGPGGQEIRTWVVVAGAGRSAKGSILAYEPIPAWSTGCGIAALDLIS
jgi:2,3-dihydroxyphenylpropionate 1,2-dioxygenase